MNISYDWYKIFYYVVRSGNITGAAQQLYVSQPAVSQSIRQLENALGCRLFLRIPKGVVLTAEGETLYRHIARAMEQIELGEKHLQAQLWLESGEIRIGASDMTLEYYLLKNLEEFHLRYPKVKISITNGPTPEALRILEADRIDFGVVSQPLSDGHGLKVTPVRPIEDIFICGKQWAQKLSLPLSAAQLETLPLILLEGGTSTRAYVDAHFRALGIALVPEFKLATSSLIVQFVQRNLGIGCVVRDFARDALSRGAVQEVPLQQPLPGRQICVAQKPEPP
ncbi:MAG: LysR family transcriptional regulator, partial [Eubacteriales bacterium]|nr:LysR family transcriptional regulator [Eubacteriales bacterium]